MISRRFSATRHRIRYDNAHATPPFPSPTPTGRPFFDRPRLDGDAIGEGGRLATLPSASIGPLMPPLIRAACTSFSAACAPSRGATSIGFFRRNSSQRTSCAGSRGKRSCFAPRQEGPRLPGSPGDARPGGPPAQAVVRFNPFERRIGEGSGNGYSQPAAVGSGPRRGEQPVFLVNRLVPPQRFPKRRGARSWLFARDCSPIFLVEMSPFCRGCSTGLLRVGYETPVSNDLQGPRLQRDAPTKPLRPAFARTNPGGSRFSARGARSELSAGASRVCRLGQQWPGRRGPDQGVFAGI